MDITLRTHLGYFNYRVGAIIIDSNKLLMVKNINSPYYYSVGGRVKFGESSESAVLREVYEETNINFEIDRLTFIHENFFTIDNGKDPYHEIALFYLMKHNDYIKNIKCDSLDGNGRSESLHWLPIEKLSDFEVYPDFFKLELLNTNNKFGHFITENKQTYRCL